MASPTTTNQPQQESQSRNSGWWETYVIRYLVGTVVGGALLLFLNTSQLSGLESKLLPGITDLASLDAGLLTVIGAMGFTYCYLASAPILVLHASRAVFFSNNSKVSFWMIGGGVLILGVMGGFLCWGNVEWKLIFSIAALAIVLVLQIVPLTFSMRGRAAVSHEYYEKLSAARADERPGRQEYKESYRHLREHGNAFFILVLEGVLGIVLLGLPNAGFALICLLVWIAPAAAVWCHGTWLEVRYAGI